jgi:hypothetical protein
MLEDTLGVLIEPRLHRRDGIQNDAAQANARNLMRKCRGVVLADSERGAELGLAAECESRDAQLGTRV